MTFLGKYRFLSYAIEIVSRIQNIYTFNYSSEFVYSSMYNIQRKVYFILNDDRIEKVKPRNVFEVFSTLLYKFSDRI